MERNSRARIETTLTNVIVDLSIPTVPKNELAAKVRSYFLRATNFQSALHEVKRDYYSDFFQSTRTDQNGS